MAENWTVAFGRYLRELRERRGLSLNEVATLSQAFADDVQKGYLSRVENGRQRLAFSKVIALSRIYEVPSDVLLERMELDLELEQIGGPKTEGLGFGELLEAGQQAMARGEYWTAYAYMRDACPLASSSDVLTAYASAEEQHVFARVNVATAAIQIGRHRFVIHELDHVESQCAVRDEFRVLLYERKSVALRRLCRLDDAWEYVRRAIEVGEASRSNQRYLGFAYSGAATTSLELGRIEDAAEYHRKAHAVFSEQGRKVEMARCLGNLGQVYFDLGNYRAARRTLTAAYRQFSELEMQISMALQRLMLGVIEDSDGNKQAAESYWREAASIAKTLNNRLVEFKASFFLLQLADFEHKSATARALLRRLQQLANWLPKPCDEFDEFQLYLSRRESELRTGNAG